MLIEVNLSPKPGLVDRINCGVHRDMTLEDSHRNVLAIQGRLLCFIELGVCGAETALGAILNGPRPIGMAYEGNMSHATTGVNTHKGSIFSLELLRVATGRLLQLGQLAMPITTYATAASFCCGPVDRELHTNNSQLTAGQRLYQQLGFVDTRGEAKAGYPLVINRTLPHHLALLDQGLDPELALPDILSLLMATSGDTNVASRGGRGGLR